MRHFLFCLFSFCVAPPPLNPPRSSGNGAVSLKAQGVNIVFHISETDGALSSLLDVPGQGATGVPTGETTFEGTTLTITVPAINAVYTGTLDGDLITGEFAQGDGEGLNLSRVAEGANVPIDVPQAPFPYTDEEVRVASPGGVTIAGTLTIPNGAGPFPAVVLVSGSGAQARDSDLDGNRMFYVLADYLARRGIAVLRYDDRGTAESTGDYDAATTADLALDTQAVTEYLAARSETGLIGIVGHSEGGAIGPMVSVASDAVDFLVLLAGPAISGQEVLHYQFTRGLDDVDVPPEALAAYKRGATAMLAEVASGEAATAADRALAAYAAEAEGVDMSPLAPYRITDERIASLARGLAGPWSRFFIGYDPAPTLREVSVPTLALFAARDQQVRAEDNVPAAVEALAGAPEGSAVVVLPDLNHLFQPTKTGNVTEYSTIRQSYARPVMDRVANWILDR